MHSGHVAVRAAKANVLGGEDAAFLLGLVDSGIRLRWAAGARVKEHVAPERVDPNQMIRRKFRNGQVRSLVCFNRGGWRALQGLAWMGVGLVQLFVHGLLSKIIPAKRLHYRLRAAGALGKVLWARPFWHMSAGALQQARPITDRSEHLLTSSL